MSARWMVAVLGAWLGAWAAGAAAEGGRRVDVTVWGEAVVGPHMTDRQAKRAALDDARARAVEQATGVRVVSGGEYAAALERAHFLLTLAHGFVVEEGEPYWELDRYVKTPGEAPVLRHRVRLRAVVAVPARAQTPDFAVEVKLNRSVFEAGECATLELTATREAWVYVVNPTADDRARLLLPNLWQPAHRVEPGKPLAFPAHGCGVELEMQPLPGDPESAEAFLVLAFPEATGLERRVSPETDLPMTDFYRRLADFPLSQAAMTLVPYAVKAKAKAR